MLIPSLPSNSVTGFLLLHPAANSLILRPLDTGSSASDPLSLPSYTSLSERITSTSTELCVAECDCRRSEKVVGKGRRRWLWELRDGLVDGSA